MTGSDALVLAGAAAAGFVQGVSGFALGLVAMVFWSGVLPPTVAAPLIALGSVAGQALSIRQVWPSLDLRRAAPMVLGGVLGVAPGVLLLPLIDPGAFRTVVGVLLCVYCPVMLLLGRIPHIRWGGRAADGAVGFIGGVMGGLAGLAGPAPILWCALRGWDRDTQRAMFQTFLLAAQAAGLVAFAAAGLLTAELGRLALWVLPAILVPSWLGTRLYARLGGETFRRLVLVVLLLTGAVLAGQGALSH